MKLSFAFFANSLLFGAGLAMDAFSVSLANGLNEPKMKRTRMYMIAGTFALFQTGMPLAGWVCVHTIVTCFRNFEKYSPWIALVLLLWIGGKMIIEGIRGDDAKDNAVGAGGLVFQGVATSIDALSVGFTIAEYPFAMAAAEAAIIGAVTFVLCMAGLVAGRRAGTKLAGKASVLGGAILVFIGIEIFVTGAL